MFVYFIGGREWLLILWHTTDIIHVLNKESKRGGDVCWKNVHCLQNIRHTESFFRNEISRIVDEIFASIAIRRYRKRQRLENDFFHLEFKRFKIERAHTWICYNNCLSYQQHSAEKKHLHKRKKKSSISTSYRWILLELIVL